VSTSSILTAKSTPCRLEKTVSRETRRKFLQQSVSGGAACVAGGAVVAQEAFGAQDITLANMPIVDTHQHLWDLDVFQPPWLQNAAPVLRQRYSTQEYLQATQGLNVVKAVYMEIDVDPSQQLQEAEYVIQLCRMPENPTVAAVISGRPASQDFDAYISRFQGSPYIKGVRQVLHADSAKPRLCLDAQFVRSIQRLGELGMSFDLCMRPGELSHGRQLTQQCPDTRFIVDHCGNADPKAFLKQVGVSEKAAGHNADAWKRDMDGLAARPNVVCKISGIVAQAPSNWTADQLAPIVNFCLDRFGPDRVMFGGDWPVCRLRASYRQWVEALWQIVATRSVSERKRLFHDNAVKFYGLA
jgi:predicted TIM-barrel fold metal-dependent hydrolase